MFQSRNAILAAVALAVATLLAAPADAAPKGRKVKLTELCTGELVDVSLSPAPFMEFSGQGLSNTAGAYTISGGHFFNPETGELQGAFTQTTLDGATLSGTYEGVFYPAEDDVFVFEVTVTYTEGTGRLEGVTGEGEAQAVLFGSAPGARLAYSTEGYHRIP